MKSVFVLSLFFLNVYLNKMIKVRRLKNVEDEKLIELKRYLEYSNHLIKLEEDLLNVESDFFQTIVYWWDDVG